MSLFVLAMLMITCHAFTYAVIDMAAVYEILFISFGKLNVHNVPLQRGGMREVFNYSCFVGSKISI